MLPHVEAWVTVCAHTQRKTTGIDGAHTHKTTTVQNEVTTRQLPVHLVRVKKDIGFVRSD
jgi:hypothetical protein